MTSPEEARRLGAMLRCAELTDPFEYRFLFDLTANTFLQKLVSKTVMDRKLSFAPGESFRSLVVLTYAATVLGGGERLLDNIGVLFAELRKKSRKATLPLALVVTEIALFAAEHPELADEAKGGRRFVRLDVRCACDSSELDPYYEAMGFLLGDQLRTPGAAARIASKGQYQAAVFADALLPAMRSGAEAVGARLAGGEAWEASLEALRSCASSARLSDLEPFFRA